jgi:hypothetical protein
VTKPILANFYYPQAVPGGISPYGVAFDPLAVGSTTVTVTGPAGVLTMSTNGVRTVTVTTPGITVNSNNVTIGAGLQKGFYAASLGGSAHGGVTVRIASSDPTIALVSVNASTAGAAFIDVPVANGSTTANYYLQGTAVGSTGDVTITASVTGFTSGSGTLHIVQPALRIENLVTSLAATAQNDEFFVRLGIPNAQNATLADLQELRVGGGNLTVNLTNSNSTAAQLVTQAGGAQTRTVVINAGQNFSPGNVPTGGVALDPLQAGSTTVTASATGFTTTTAGAVAVTITP